MSSFMILFIWLGFSSLSKVVLSAADDDTFLLNPTDASDPNPLWSTDDDGLTLLSDTANGCTSLDSGFLGKLRARGQCGDIPSSPINDGNLFSFDGPLNVEGSSDIALLDQDQLSNSDSLFGSDTLSSLDPTSDISISVGAACQSSNPQFLRRFRPRGAACKNPELVKKSPTWDPNLDLGIYTQGHPDYEWLRRLPFAPGRNNDEACPSWVVGYRYAVCGPSNEAQDVIGWGTTLRSCSLFVAGVDECIFPKRLWCCEIYYELLVSSPDARREEWQSFAHYCIPRSSYADQSQAAYIYEKQPAPI